MAIALASLGQICVRLGNLKRAEEALNRALDVRSPLQFMRETTGAVFDTLAQIHLIRGDHDAASRSLQKAREAYGETSAQSRWYQWSVRVLDARLRCGAAMPKRRWPCCAWVIAPPTRRRLTRAAGRAHRDRGAARSGARTMRSAARSVSTRIQPGR